MTAVEEDLELIEPTLDLIEDLRAMAGEYLRWGTSYERARYRDALRDLPGYVRELRQQARGVDRPPGWVPSTTYWLVRDGRRIVATSNLRHRLTPHLHYEGGHIGYGTRPSERRKGYGRRLCALTLQRARELGIRHVLITCDSDNIASAKIIEANGGVLENQVVSRETGKIKNRYWIDVGEPDTQSKLGDSR